MVEDLGMLDVVCDLFLGPAKDMTSEAPVPDPDNLVRFGHVTLVLMCH